MASFKIDDITVIEDTVRIDYSVYVLTTPDTGAEPDGGRKVFTIPLAQVLPVLNQYSTPAEQQAALIAMFEPRVRVDAEQTAKIRSAFETVARPLIGIVVDLAAGETLVKIAASRREKP